MIVSNYLVGPRELRGELTPRLLCAPRKIYGRTLVAPTVSNLILSVNEWIYSTGLVYRSPHNDQWIIRRSTYWRGEGGGERDLWWEKLYSGSNFVTKWVKCWWLGQSVASQLWGAWGCPTTPVVEIGLIQNASFFTHGYYRFLGTLPPELRQPPPTTKHHGITCGGPNTIKVNRMPRRRVWAIYFSRKTNLIDNDLAQCALWFPLCVYVQMLRSD